VRRWRGYDRAMANVDTVIRLSPNYGYAYFLRAPAMANGRCGASTGPRTPEGREQCRKAPWKHGGRAAEVREAARWRGARRAMARILALIV
jgi:hypothetical protein